MACFIFSIRRKEGGGGSGLISPLARSSSLLTPNCPKATMTLSAFRFCPPCALSNQLQQFLKQSSFETEQNQMNPLMTWLPATESGKASPDRNGANQI